MTLRELAPLRHHELLALAIARLPRGHQGGGHAAMRLARMSRDGLIGLLLP